VNKKFPKLKIFKIKNSTRSPKEGEPENEEKPKQMLTTFIGNLGENRN
jgi:hypothetical protein